MKKSLAVFVFGLMLLPAATHAAFDADLRYGSSGAPVLELQEFLTAQGVYTGPISGNFYSLTLAGVKALQAKLNVSPQSGFFGPLTRGKANELLAADLKESDEEATSTPVVNVPNRKVSTRTNNQASVSTGGETVATFSPSVALKAANADRVKVTTRAYDSNGTLVVDGVVTNLEQGEDWSLSAHAIKRSFVDKGYEKDYTAGAQLSVSRSPIQCDVIVPNLAYNLCQFTFSVQSEGNSKTKVPTGDNLPLYFAGIEVDHGSEQAQFQLSTENRQQDNVSWYAH